MNKSLAASLAALGAAAVIAGCGGTYSNSTTPGPTPTPIPTPSIACTAPPGFTVALAYPPPGPAPTASPAYGIAAPAVIIAVAPTPLPTNWYVYVVANSLPSPAPTPGASATPFTFFGSVVTAPPSPLPSLLKDPGLPNQTFQLSPNGGFANGGTFTTYLANTNCFPGVQIPGGSFSS
jgi:hypothetical protein